MLNPSRLRSSSELTGAIIGTLLGDSGIHDTNRFNCEQISENLIKYKKSIIQQLVSEDITIHSRQRSPAIVHTNQTESIFKPTYAIKVRHALFRKLREELYISGTKQVTMSTLSKLTDEGLALWIMDDGTLWFNPKNHTKYLRLCTDSFDDFSINQIQQFFSERYNTPTKVFLHNSGNGSSKKPRIQFNAASAQIIISKVYPYMLPEFYYKLDLHYAESTIKSKRCSDDYRNAVKYMLQHSSF